MGQWPPLRTHAGLLTRLRCVLIQSIATSRESTSDIGWHECNNELRTSGCIQPSQPDLSPAVPKPCDWSARSGMSRTIRTFVSWHFGRDEEKRAGSTVATRGLRRARPRTTPQKCASTRPISHPCCGDDKHIKLGRHKADVRLDSRLGASHV